MGFPTLADFLKLAVKSPFHVISTYFWLFYDQLIIIHSLTPHIWLYSHYLGNLIFNAPKNYRNFHIPATFPTEVKKSLEDQENILH